MSRHLQTLFLLAVLSFLFVIPTQAQVTTASMSGTVMFQDEPVIGATVLAVHEPSGTNYGTITNVDGRFSLQGMRTGGPYKVTISYVGYQSAVYSGITLQLGENYNLNVKLKESSETLGRDRNHSGENEVQYGKDGCDNQYLLVTDHLFTHH